MAGLANDWRRTRMITLGVLANWKKDRLGLHRHGGGCMLRGYGRGPYHGCGRMRRCEVLRGLHVTRLLALSATIIWISPVGVLAKACVFRIFDAKDDEEADDEDGRDGP